MKTHVWVTVPFVLVVAASWSACGGSNSNPGTGGHVTTTTTHMTTTSHTTTTTTPPLAACDAPSTAPSHGSCYTAPVHTPPASCHMDGGAPDAGGASDAGAGDGGDAGTFTCAGSIPNANACGVCVEGSCCSELAACNSLANCWACLTDPNADPTTCMAQAITDAIDAITTCQGSCCEDICNPPCNPVTNSGCDATNMEACDIDVNTAGAYSCYSTDGTALCQMCDEVMGPYCAAGMTCLSDGSCAAFCCADSDCGTGKCDKTMIPSETVLGVCVHK